MLNPEQFNPADTIRNLDSLLVDAYDALGDFSVVLGDEEGRFQKVNPKTLVPGKSLWIKIEDKQKDSQEFLSLTLSGPVNKGKQTRRETFSAIQKDGSLSFLHEFILWDNESGKIEQSSRRSINRRGLELEYSGGNLDDLSESVGMLLALKNTILERAAAHIEIEVA